MRKYKTWLIEIAIDLALKKACPARIPRSGLEGEAVNCASVTLQLGDGGVDVLVEGRSDDCVLGRAWSIDRYESPCAIPMRHLADFSMKAKRFYGLFQFAHETPVDFIASEYSLRPQRALLKDRIYQWLFNIKTPTRTSRIEALRILVDEQIEAEGRGFGQQAGISELVLLERAKGRRIYRRPDFWRFQREARLILESLVLSQDATVQEGTYTATGKALQTIAAYEEQNRRNGQQVRQTWVMITLTAIAALATAVQAYLAFGATSPECRASAPRPEYNSQFSRLLK